MARGRMLNKSVSLSQKFSELPDDTCRLLATWIIPHLDYRGVFYGDAAIVRSQVMPLSDTITNVKVGEYMQAMAKVGLIQFFESKGRKWQHWAGFADNQIGLRPDREGTEFPPPPAEFVSQEPSMPDAESGNYDNRSNTEVNTEEIPPKGKEEKLNRSTSTKEDKENHKSANAPDSPPRKNKSVKDTDERSKHPAILAFREVTQRYPAKELYDEIIALCGETPDISRMRACWVDWLRVSNNRYNTIWLLEWYANGASGNPDKKPPISQRQNQQQRPNEPAGFANLRAAAGLPV